MPQQRKRVLIVGAGRIAGLNEAEADRRKPCTHAGAIMGQASLALVGVVDQDRGRAEAFAARFALPYFGDRLESALDEVQPDIVTVAVPYKLQHDVALAVAASRRPPRRLLLEKPLAESLGRAEAIMAACRRAGIVVLVNNECAAPVYAQMRRILSGQFADGAISVSAWCSSGMHAVGVHLLGILRFLFGPVAWVRAVAEAERVESLPFSTNFVPDDPRIHAMMMFESGLTGFLTNSALTRYTSKEIEVTCRTGRMRLSDNGNLLQVWGTATPGRTTISYRLAPPETVEIDRGTAFSAIGSFLGAADEAAGQELLGGAVGLEVYRILDALLRSSREQREIQLNSNR